MQVAHELVNRAAQGPSQAVTQGLVTRNENTLVIRAAQGPSQTVSIHRGLLHEQEKGLLQGQYRNLLRRYTVLRGFVTQAVQGFIEHQAELELVKQAAKGPAGAVIQAWKRSPLAVQGLL
jgi:hypothetical protein